MNTYTVYITTDSNRQFFDVQISDQIALTAFEMQNSTNTTFCGAIFLNRIVFTENHMDIEKATKRMQEIKRFTKMQLEKIIRKTNPNWNNLFNTAAAHARTQLTTTNPLAA